MATHRGTWKRCERDIADLLTKALNTEAEFGQTVKRNILSGANNRRDDGSPRPGDVVLPCVTVEGKSEPVYDLHVEHKYRASHAHQTLLDEAEADGKKHGLNNTVLITKVKRQQGHTAVMDLDLFLRLLSVPQARALLQRIALDTKSGQFSLVAPGSKSAGKTRSRRKKADNQDQNQQEDS